MSHTRYRFYETTWPYFMTWTIVGWLPVLNRPDVVNIILESWRYLQREREFTLLGYVILGNHLHLIAAAPALPAAIKDSKSYTARSIVDLLETRGERDLLHQLHAHKLPHKTQSDYQVWQQGSHPQQIDHDRMMWQKLEYTHNNPLRRGYVDDPLHWRYSSARNYAGQKGLIEVVTDWM